MSLTSGLATVARTVGAVGLVGVGALHAAWAFGSNWPARDEHDLADAVTGLPEMPPPAASAAVAVGLTGAGIVVAGALGDRPVAVWARRAVGAALLARGLAADTAAGRLLGLPEASARFRRLDARFYRPLCGVLGVASVLSSATPKTVSR